MTDATKHPVQSQSDKFKEAARAAGCDENEARWDETLRKVAKAKPSGSEPSPKS